MLKNYKGFSLVEVIGSFAVFVILLTVLLPILMKIYEERTMLTYKEEGLLLLHNEKESFLYDYDFDGEKEITVDTRRYQLTIQKNGEFVQLCMNWEVPWKKKGRVCTYAKK